MYPDGTLEFRPENDSALVNRVVNADARYKGGNGQERTHGRRASPRKWARRIQRPYVAGAELGHAQLLSVVEESSLAERIRTGDMDAEQKLIVANMGLVLKAVNDYVRFGVAEDDLIQEGNLGLMRAARHFDPSAHATRFATYATYWIRCFMIRALASNISLVQGPQKSHQLRVQYREAHDELQARGITASGEAVSKSPTLDEIARHLGVTPARLEKARLMENERAVYANLGDLALAEGLTPDNDFVKHEDQELVSDALWRLSPFEAWVICERFGLDVPPDQATRRPDRRSSPGHQTKTHASTVDATDEAPVNGGRPRSSYFRKSYLDMQIECGLSVFRLRQVEKTALEKLRMVLAEHAPGVS